MVRATLADRRAPPRPPLRGGRLPALQDLDARATLAYINDGKMLLALRSARHKLAAATACRNLVSRSHHPMLQVHKLDSCQLLSI
jgi:hypothetical protein